MPYAKRSTPSHLIGYAALLALAGCGGGDGDPIPPEPPATPTTVTISPASVTLNAVGDQQQYQAQVLDQRGRAMSGVTVTWSSTQPGVAEVDRATGLATAAGPGTAGIRAVAQRVSGEVTLEVVQVPVALEKTQGDGEVGFFGEALAVSPAVRVLDANGHPAPGKGVVFEVTSGGGSVFPEVANTGPDGEARTEWTMGEDSVQTLSASASGLTAEFTVTAIEPPLEILTDSLAWGRATLDYLTELSAKGGSRMGYVWSLADGAALPGGLEITADGRIQGTPEEAGVSEVEVRVTDSNGRDTTTTFGLRVCDAPLGLEVGDVTTVDPEELEPCGFLVVADEAGAYYRVTFAGLNGERRASWQANLLMEPLPGQTAAFRPTVARRGARRPAEADQDWAATSAAWSEMREIERANEQLHREIRRQEAELMREMMARGPLEILPDRPVAQARRTAVTPVTFKLYDRSPGATNRCAVHQTVVADVIAENDDFIVYEDVEATSPVSVENANRIIDFYTEHGKEIIERYFGGVSDVNGDGKIALLVDATLPGVQAFVWSADFTFPATSCPASNEMELVHMSVGGFDFGNDRYWALSALVHEVKHVSSMYKRVVNHRLRGGTGENTFHPVWIEEGTAEIGKEMSSRLAWERAGGPAAGARAFGDTMRIALREHAPEFYGVFSMMNRTVLAFSQDPNGITFDPGDRLAPLYGSGWHFHRFLRDWAAGGGTGMDMAGDEALVTALNDSLTAPGVEGIEDVMGMTMAEMLHAHAIAMTVAGSEDVLIDDATPRFLSYDFPTATEIFINPDPPGRYPWPRTLTGDDDLSSVPAAVLGEEQRFNGRVTSNGIRVLDFEAMEAGARAVFRVTAGPEVSVIVARIVKPPGF
ncbi:MAG: Ig-like domain-containing protein [Gemmatimonadota bacterium]|nr:Ig-like domain-containing protein [Gemmatimonadota bacterium]